MKVKLIQLCKYSKCKLLSDTGSYMAFNTAEDLIEQIEGKEKE